MQQQASRSVIINVGGTLSALCDITINCLAELLFFSMSFPSGAGKKNQYKRLFKMCILLLENVSKLFNVGSLTVQYQLV